MKNQNSIICYYLHEKFQIYAIDTKCMIYAGLLHIGYHYNQILLQTNGQFIPIHFIHAVNHVFVALTSQFSEIAINKNIYHATK